MSQKPSKYRRRNYYIDKDFQTKFILKFCSLVAFGSLLTVALIYRSARHSTTVGIVRWARGRAHHGRVSLAFVAPDCFCSACDCVFGSHRYDAFVFS